MFDALFFLQKKKIWARQMVMLHNEFYFSYLSNLEIWKYVGEALLAEMKSVDIFSPKKIRKPQNIYC